MAGTTMLPGPTLGREDDSAVATLQPHTLGGETFGDC
jgi:hypothetical protein